MNTKKRFLQTRELVRLARTAGLTQDEIAGKCRVSQSTISKWAKGSHKAYEHQIEWLLEEFGHKLRRKTFRLYQSRESDDSPVVYTKIDGPVIFDEAYDRSQPTSDRSARPPAQRRLVVHHRGTAGFTLIDLFRIEIAQGSRSAKGAGNADWLAVPGTPLHATELIVLVDRYTSGLTSSTANDDARRLRFGVRKALLDHGFPVTDVVDPPSK